MKFNKPKFWDTKFNLIAFILLPFALIVQLIVFFRKKFIKSKKFNIPIICIGNIYLGGTGKTPASIYIGNQLLELKKNPVIVRKFYKNQKDEYDLIKKNFNNIIINKKRASAILEAQKMNYDAVILDDGFQDYSIKKDLNIICFNQNQLIGNGQVLPSGPLRENLNSLIEANIVLINGKKDNNFENKILEINKNIEIFYSYYKPENIDQFKNKELLAIAGIGNPENFFRLIKESNLNIKKKLIFPDHYEFTETEVQNIIRGAKEKNYHIIMTEKDYYKIKHFNKDELKYLKVYLEIEKKEKFVKRITELYDKKN